MTICAIRYSFSLILLPQLIGCGLSACLTLALFLLWWPLVLLTLFPVCLAWWRYLDWQTTFYILTPESITKHYGIIFKNTESIPTTSILKRNVSVLIPGSDIGSVVLETAAQSANNLSSIEGDMVLRNIPAAPAVAATIYYLGGGPAPTNINTPEEALTKLQALVDSPSSSPIKPQSAPNQPPILIFSLVGAVALLLVTSIPLAATLLKPPQTQASSLLPYLSNAPFYGFHQVKGQPPTYWIARISNVRSGQDGSINFTIFWSTSREPNNPGLGHGKGEGTITPEGRVHVEITELISNAAPKSALAPFLGETTSTSTQPVVLDGSFIPQAKGASFFTGKFMQRGNKYYPNCTWLLSPTPPKGWRNP